MSVQFLPLGLAFLEGLGLILSPCILPVLPIVLAASLDGGKRRPLGIIAGFMLSFTVFALVSRQVLSWLNVDTEIVRNVALGFLVLFGLVMLSQTLSERLLSRTQKLADLGQTLSSRYDKKEGFWGGVGIGALIGLIWTPCAGPILAAAVVQIIQAKTNYEAALTVVLFALGAGIPMLLIALTGRKIMSRFSFFAKHSAAVRRALGVVVIAFAVLIYSGFDVALLAATGGSSSPAPKSDNLQHALANPYPAPDFAEGAWINSQPLKIADLKGKVVLVDFWTYSCINCVRTFPYLTKWDEKYRGKGLVIVGVHSPEFAFEKKLDNVKGAVQRYGIKYPVVLDNDLKTWGNYDNHYWPAHYLIDKTGNVVATHFGEGEYDVTEENIRHLLGMSGGDNVEAPSEGGGSSVQTPETYLGYARADNFASNEGLARDTARAYTFPGFLGLNNWALSGEWAVDAESITAQSANAALRLNFIARKVFLVLGTKDGKPIPVRVLLNGNLAGGSADVKNGILTVDRETLYELIDQGKTTNGLLEIQSTSPGLQAYAFTFGG